jgi:hypothetical protein
MPCGSFGQLGQLDSHFAHAFSDSTAPSGGLKISRRSDGSSFIDKSSSFYLKNDENRVKMC